VSKLGYCKRCELPVIERCEFGPHHGLTITDRELSSEIRPLEAMTAPLRIVLVRSLRAGEWVTRVQNMQTGGQAHGNYFESWELGFDNYLQRCKQYGVKP